MATPLSVVCVEKLIGARVAATDLAGLSFVVDEDVEMLQVIVVELSCLVDMADLSPVAGDTVDMLSCQLLLVTLLPLTDAELPSVVKEHVDTLPPLLLLVDTTWLLGKVLLRMEQGILVVAAEVVELSSVVDD